MAQNMINALLAIHAGLDSHKNKKEINMVYSKLTDTSGCDVAGSFHRKDVIASAEAIRLFLVAAANVRVSEDPVHVNIAKAWDVYHGKTNDLLIVAASLFCRTVELVERVIVIPAVWKVVRAYTPQLKSIVMVGQALRGALHECDHSDMTARDFSDMEAGVAEKLHRVEGMYVAEVGLMLRTKSRAHALYCFHIAVHEFHIDAYNDWLLDCAWRVAKDQKSMIVARSCLTQLIVNLQEEKKDDDGEESGGEHSPDRVEQITSVLEKHRDEIDLFIFSILGLDVRKLADTGVNCHRALLVSIPIDEMRPLLAPIVLK